MKYTLDWAEHCNSNLCAKKLDVNSLKVQAIPLNSYLNDGIIAVCRNTVINLLAVYLVNSFLASLHHYI